MSDLMKPTLEVIRDRMNRATPGPWGWFGNTAVQHIYLATQRWGRHMVMQFDRWGMQNAQPTFFERPKPEQVRKSIVADSVFRKASDVPVYEVAPHARSKSNPAVYREDLVGIRNADATFIAHSREDVEWLVAEVDRLTALLAEGSVVVVDGKPQTLRHVGWQCKHEWRAESDGQHTEWDSKKGKPVARANVSASMRYADSWRENEYRCAWMKPVYMIVDAEEALR